jgi:deoxyribonuclease V
MHFEHKHSWQVTTKQAVAIQNKLRGKVITCDNLGDINTVAGVDVGFENNGMITRAAIAVLTFPLLELLTVAIARRKTSFPYIPGLLSFRELPAVLEAMAKLTSIPDLMLCDGQGYAHPRRFGIACHLGVLTDTPSIGVGKTRLLGVHKTVANQRGAWQPLVDNNETIGAVVRTRVNVKPIYISIGHRLGLYTAIDYVMRCTTRYKFPETTRQAHKYASVTRKDVCYS